MTYVISVNRAFDNQIEIAVKNGGLISKIRIPARPDLVRSALSTYQDFRYQPAEDVPKNIRNLALGTMVNITV